MATATRISEPEREQVAHRLALELTSSFEQIRVILAAGDELSPVARDKLAYRAARVMHTATTNPALFTLMDSLSGCITDTAPSAICTIGPVKGASARAALMNAMERIAPAIFAAACDGPWREPGWNATDDLELLAERLASAESLKSLRATLAPFAGTDWQAVNARLELEHANAAAAHRHQVDYSDESADAHNSGHESDETTEDQIQNAALAQLDDSATDAQPVGSSIPTDLDDHAMLSPRRLADIFKVPHEAFRKRLERYRRSNHNGWIENPERGPTEPQYLYSVRVGKQITEHMSASSVASSKRPA